MTKANKSFYNQYLNATARELHDVYGTYSKEKFEAMTYCKKLQYNMNGYDGRICSANTWQFTYAFQYVNEAGKNCLAYITARHNRFFEIDED